MTSLAKANEILHAQNEELLYNNQKQKEKLDMYEEYLTSGNTEKIQELLLQVNIEGILLL